MLYERDYRILTSDEQKQVEAAQAFYKEATADLFISAKDMNKYGEMLPDVFDHYSSLFPNNYLSPFLLSEVEKNKKIIDDFKRILESQCSERDLLNFIRDRQAYFMIGAILTNRFDFGHHDLYVFKEFPLPPNFQSDFLICGKNSEGHHFVFVEMENPEGGITTKKGDYGTTIRKGIKQIDEWNSWLESNFANLRLVFEKYTKANEVLPNEFSKLDTSRIHYVVVAGRRTHFSAKTYENRRRDKLNKNLLVLHYDNIVDYSNNLIKGGSF